MKLPGNGAPDAASGETAVETSLKLSSEKTEERNDQMRDGSSKYCIYGDGWKWRISTHIHSNSNFLNDNPLEFWGVPTDFQTHPYWDGWNTVWNTRFGGMNIHLPAILGVNKRGAGFWPLEEYHIVLSACQNGSVAKVKSDVRNDKVYPLVN